MMAPLKAIEETTQVIVAMWRPRESALNLRFNTSFIFRETPETAWLESRRSIAVSNPSKRIELWQG
jgi:hypothetical protein